MGDARSSSYKSFISPRKGENVLEQSKNLAVKMYLDGRRYYRVLKNTYEGHLRPSTTGSSLTQFHCNSKLLKF